MLLSDSIPLPILIGSKGFFVSLSQAVSDSTNMSERVPSRELMYLIFCLIAFSD